MNKFNASLRKDFLVRYRRYKAMIKAGLAMADIGRAEGISRERVRQVIAKGDKLG
jgi:DNA-binding CsgD family transcriptional regulator